MQEKIESATNPALGPTVISITEDRMGRGNEELGSVLIKAFIHTLLDIETKPDTIIFYNTGVKLTVKNSEVIDDLKISQARGVEILICGTCANYFEIKDEIGVGVISNMYDIAEKLLGAARLVSP